MSEKLVLFLIGILFIVYVHGTKVSDVEGCSVVSTDGKMYLDLKDFHNNSPKTGEVFRLKWYFHGKFPFVLIEENGERLIFAQSNRNRTQFGIYLSYEDWRNSKTPCQTELFEGVFSRNENVEVDTILHKGLIYF